MVDYYTQTLTVVSGRQHQVPWDKWEFYGYESVPISISSRRGRTKPHTALVDGLMVNVDGLMVNDDGSPWLIMMLNNKPENMAWWLVIPILLVTSWRHFFPAFIRPLPVISAQPGSHPQAQQLSIHRKLLSISQELHCLQQLVIQKGSILGIRVVHNELFLDINWTSKNDG